MEPTNLNSISSQLNGANGDGNLASLEFRRIVCEGVYDERKSIFVGPRSRIIFVLMENGYYVLTPLLLSKEPGRYSLMAVTFMAIKRTLPKKSERTSLDARLFSLHQQRPEVYTFLLMD